MSIQTELTRITNAKAAIKTAIEGKGVTVPNGTLLDGMASLIASIEAGGGSGTEVIITSAVTNALEFAKAIFPNYPNGFDPNAVYAAGWKGISDSTPVNNQIGAFVIIANNVGDAFAAGLRYRGSGITSIAFTSEYDAAVTIGDKYVWYKL